MIKGIDVSYAQGRPNWKLIKESSEVDFVYVKASEGLASKGPDSSFSYNWKSLLEFGIPRGAYHFYRPSIDPTKQAETFFNIVGELKKDDLPPVIDVEVPPAEGQSTSQYAENVKKFIERAEELFKRKIVVYTGGPIFNSSTKGAPREILDFISDRELWLAAYVTDPNKFIPTAWTNQKKSWSIWQKSGDIGANNSPGKIIPGIKGVVDYNEFTLNVTSLQEWIGASHPVVKVNENIEPEFPIEIEIETSQSTPVNVEVQTPEVSIDNVTKETQPVIELRNNNFLEIFLGYIKFIFSIFFRSNK